MAQFPYADIIVDGLTVSDNVSLISSDTRSKQFLTRRTLGQRYEIEMTCRVLPDKFRAANAYITSLRGGAAVTQITLPFYGESPVTDKSTAASAAIGLRAITLASVTGVEPGLYMQFAGHTKLYCVTSLSGNVVNFEPNLIRAVASGETVKFNGVQVHCKLGAPNNGFASTGNRIPVTRNLKFIEVIG
jgi:hypothetical protein